MNVLLVDDEPGMLKMMKTMLQSNGLQVFDVLHAKDAMLAAQDHRIDVLVADLVLGTDMDGFTLARWIVAEHPNLPVLFISGYPTEFESKRRDFRKCTFLQKPFRKADLVSAIAELAGA